LQDINPPFLPYWISARTPLQPLSEFGSRTIVITLKASNLSVNISVTTESPHSTRIGFGAETAYSEAYAVYFHILLPNRFLKTQHI
jgi:hypothetical protein